MLSRPTNGGVITMKRIITGLLLALQVFFYQQAYALTDDELKIKNGEYTCAPPYLSLNAKPNINILFDLSGSMQQPAYRVCARNEPSGSFVSACADRTVTGAELYDSTRDYYGYFDKDKYYKYTGSYFEENTCTSTTDRKGSISGTGDTGCLSGNLLNWIVTTRLDTVRKIFTGGRVKSETATDAVLESDGAKYVVTEPNLHCKFTVTATNTAADSNSNTYVETRKLAIADQTGNTCSLGTLTAANTNVLTPIEVVDGVIHGLYTQAELEVSVFAELTGDYRVGKSQPLSSYITAINSELAYGATPTGTGIKESMAFFKQTTTQTLVNGKGDYLKDPYYDSDGGFIPTSLPVPCRKSFVLLVSDGAWPNVFTTAYPAPPPGTLTEDPVPTAYAMHTTDMRPAPALGADPLAGRQTVSVYTVYAFGDGVYGRNSLITAAIFGGYDDNEGALAMPYPFTALPADSRIINGASGYPLPQCNPTGTWNKECETWAKKDTGLPYNYFEGDDGAALKNSIEEALKNMLKQTSSGTAASVMGNNDNSGSALLQAMYYPEKKFELGSSVTWIGELQAFWYYIDPLLNNITIREDSASALQLNLKNDKIADFVFVKGIGNTKDKTKVRLYVDANGDGVKDNSATPDSELDDPADAKSLWRAGLSLWSRNLTDSPRNIFTSDPKATATKLDFVSGNVANLYEYMDTNSTQAIDVINYVRGRDFDSSYGYRNRTVTIGGTDGVWKLGDIIHSTPKLLTEVRLNSYNLKQPGGYSDTSYDKYIKSKDYNWRGAAYVGANDGMLHAFKLGSNFDGTAKDIIAEIKNADKSDATDLGKELWAFIPKNTLPYLQYLLRPDYQHIYMVDATPLLIDASVNPTIYTKSDGTTITCTDATYSQCVKQTDVSSSSKLLNYNTGLTKGGTSWRTLLLGSTGLGGAVSTEQAKIKGDVNKISVTADGKHFQCANCNFVTAGFKIGTIFKASGFARAGNNGYFIATDVTANKIACSGLDKNETAGVPSAVLQQITVKTPIMDPGDTATPKTKGFGYSSVFALDVTDPITSDLSSGSYPKLLWEFTDPRLGFTTVTPAIVRIKDAADTASLPRNGKWYVVLASGPTGPIENGWFFGVSDKKLTIFVLDLKSGALVRTFNNLPSSDAYNSVNSAVHTQVSGMPNYAFAGSLSGATTDTDKFDTSRSGAYSDDAVYIGYNRANSANVPSAWDKGGVLRLLTYNDPDPANWKISTLIDGIGPVTSAVTKLQDATKSQLWLYFGTGRYYTKDDDPINVQSLFGIKDPCFISANTFATDCSTNSTYAAPAVTAATSSSGATFTGLVNQTDSVSTVAATDKGWKIDLDAASGSNYPKRVITDTLASTSGVLTFTTFTPSKDVCSYGGNTTFWAVKYDTGGSGASKLKGQLLMQLSTGAFQQVDMSANNAFSQSVGRESAPFTGVPPASPPSITANTNHFPTKRFLHIQER